VEFKRGGNIGWGRRKVELDKRSHRLGATSNDALRAHQQKTGNVGYLPVSRLANHQGQL